MTVPYVRRFRVRFYELDASGQVSLVNLVRLMQESAIEASASLGFDTEWYRQEGTAWLVRRLAIRQLGPAVYGDEIAIKTWISGIRGVRSNREYELARASDGAPLARARAEWVYVNVASGQPTRCPEAWASTLPPIGAVEDLGVSLSGGQATTGAHRHAYRHRVQFADLDMAGHVNHAVYLQWSLEGHRQALRASGLARPGEQGLPLATLAAQEIQYQAPALEADEVEIVSWVAEWGADGWTWAHEMSSAATRRPLARASSRYALVQRAEEASPRPAPLVEALIGGPERERVAG